MLLELPIAFIFQKKKKKIISALKENTATLLMTNLI